MITQEDLKEILNYDPSSGVFTWKTKTSKATIIGEVAGYSNPDGYVFIRIFKRLYRAHWLAWFYCNGTWPKVTIDHKDGCPGNNRIENLREATMVEQLRNTKTRRSNTSGYRGVCWSKQKGAWRARIKSGGKEKHLGFFNSLEDAGNAFRIEARKQYGEFYREV